MPPPTNSLKVLAVLVQNTPAPPPLEKEKKRNLPPRLRYYYYRKYGIRVCSYTGEEELEDRREEDLVHYFR